MVPLDLLDRSLRDDQRVLQALGHRPDAGELAGAQEIVWIVEQRLDLDGAGLRLDLPVDGRRLPGVRVQVAVGEDQLQRRRRAGIASAAEVLDAVGELQIFLLADRSRLSLAAATFP